MRLLDITEAFKKTQEAQKQAGRKNPGVVASELEKYVGATRFRNGSNLPDYLIKGVARRVKRPPGILSQLLRLILYTGFWGLISNAFFFGWVIPPAAIGLWQADIADACWALKPWLWTAIYLVLLFFPMAFVTIGLALVDVDVTSAECRYHVSCLFWLYIEDTCRDGGQGHDVSEPAVVVHQFISRYKSSTRHVYTRDLTILSNGAHECKLSIKEPVDHSED